MSELQLIIETHECALVPLEYIFALFFKLKSFRGRSKTHKRLRKKDSSISIKNIYIIII
jgi:hypothetical protein